MPPSVRVKKISLFRALDRYLDTVSVHKRGYQQEFWRVSVIKRHPVAQKMMDEVTSVDIASYRDERLSQVNTRTGKPISGNTVRLELALMSALYNLAKVEWGTCRTNPVEIVRKPKPSSGRDRRLTSSEERRLSKYFQMRNAHIPSGSGNRNATGRDIISAMGAHRSATRCGSFTCDEKW